MVAKENLKRRIVKGIVSPQMAIGIGLLTAIGAVPYSITAENSADKKAEQAFPKASPEQLKQARQEVLIFDSTVHNLISSGESVIDAAKFTDLSRTRQAIRTIDQENESRKQRRELRQDLQKPINKKANSIAFGSMSLLLGGFGWWILRTIIRERRERDKITSEVSSISSI